MTSNFFDYTDLDDLTSNIQALTVTQLNRYVEYVLSSDTALRNLSVQGEISGFKRYLSSGHCYFTLKDKDSCVRCVMFKGNAMGLSFSPSNGMHVLITGSASVYASSGQYQIYVQSMHSVGEGELYARFLQLKEKLDDEGLFAETHKKPLPILPQAVGVVTSSSGAVLHDIRNVIHRRFPNMNVILSPCNVQGTSASVEIVTALDLLDKSGLVDVIILGRGGGSMEDLQCFNDESVARAVFNCSTPIISAVGHETDFTVVDFVADKRAPTPSAAAEIAVPVYEELKADLTSWSDAMKRQINTKLQQLDLRLSMAKRGIAARETAIGMQELRFSYIQEKIHELVQIRLDEADRELQLMLVKAESLSPIKTLMRGYAYVHDENGECIKSAAQFAEKGQGSVKFSDGEVNVKTV